MAQAVLAQVRSHEHPKMGGVCFKAGGRPVEVLDGQGKDAANAFPTRLLSVPVCEDHDGLNEWMFDPGSDCELAVGSTYSFETSILREGGPGQKKFQVERVKDVDKEFRFSNMLASPVSPSNRSFQDIDLKCQFCGFHLRPANVRVILFFVAIIVTALLAMLEVIAQSLKGKVRTHQAPTHQTLPSARRRARPPPSPRPESRGPARPRFQSWVVFAALLLAVLVAGGVVLRIRGASRPRRMRLGVNEQLPG
uniref:Uncharacterized protein n=1 Tax=Alexandrium monilatum TaxID=311494 RepID=A0A7S4UJ30_9DINO